MEILAQQIRRAQRRLVLEQALRALSWSCTATLLAAALLVGLDKWYPLGIRLGLALGGALVVGTIIALAWTALTRRRAIDAALEIDRRFGLKERVSSCWALDSTARESAMGQALIADAVRRVEKIHVADKFRIALGPWSLLPLAPAALAFLLAVLLDPASQQQVSAKQQSQGVAEQVKTSSRRLEKRLSERRERAEKEGLKEAEQLFQRLERDAQKLARLENADRKEALVNLNNLSQDLEKRRKELSNSEALKNQFNQLKDLQKGPADRFAEAMRQGDFEKARQELQRLKNDLEAGNLKPEEREQLARQMEEMADKLNKLAEAHQRAKEDLEKKLDEARRNGMPTDELERQLREMQQRDGQMQRMQQMAEKLGECSQCLQQGQNGQAQAALGEMDAELSDLMQQLDELDLIESALDEIAEAKNSMNCKQCQGDGCAACNGGLGQRPGDGMGRGRGIGHRPEEENPTNAYDTNVKQKTDRGSAVVVDYVDGPNVKGGVQQEISAQFEQARSEEADPLTDQRLPRGYREHAKRYFDTLREGKP